MFKRLRWMVIIPGVLAGVAQAQSTSPMSTSDYVEKDLFELHIPPQGLSQKDFQSAEYRVTYLTPAPTTEEKSLLLESGKILSNRDWFLRRMEKNEEPAKSWLRAHGFNDTGKDAPSAEQMKKAVDAQKARLKKAVSDYNALVANVLEKRKVPAPESVVEEVKDNCEKDHQNIASTSTEATGFTGRIPTTFAPEMIARLSKDMFKIHRTEILQDTNAESAKQAEAARRDSSYVTQSGAPDGAVSDSTVGTVAPEKIAIPSSYPLTSLVTDPTNQNIAYAISKDEPQSIEGNFIVTRTTEHIMKSTDGGKTWTEQGKITAEKADDRSFSGFRKMTVSSDGHELYVTSDAGVNVSRDGGKTFSVIPDSPKEALDVKTSKDGRLAVTYANGRGVVIFENGSGTWKKASPQPSDLVSWVNEKASTEPRCSETGTDCPYGGGKNPTTYAVQFDPNDKDTIYAGMGRGLYRYRPSTGWQLMKNVYGDSMVYNIDVSPAGKISFATCNGVYQAQSSASNEPLVFQKDRSTAFIDQRDNSTNPNYLRANDVVSNPEDPRKLVATSASGVYVSSDTGQNWTRISGGELPSQDSRGNYVQFDSAVWVKGGAVEVSGGQGTYRFTP